MNFPTIPPEAVNMFDATVTVAAVRRLPIRGVVACSAYRYSTACTA